MNEKEQQAAEYALGTLDPSERERISRARFTDTELDNLIIAWELRLTPLNDQVAEAIPSDHVFSHIEAQLDAAERQTAKTAEIDVQTNHAEKLIQQLQQRIRRWQWSAVSGFGLAAAFMGLWIMAVPQTAPPIEPFVAVFQQDDQQPAFLMSVDLNSRVMKIQPVNAQGVPGKTYQLWIKADSLGPTPQSLGLLQTVNSATVKQLNDFDPELLRKAIFGISVEPEGGSPTGQPTGPAIHGRLYPAGTSI